MDTHGSVQSGPARGPEPHWLRDRRREGDGPRPARDDAQGLSPEQERSPEQRLCCAACSAPVTSLADRSARAGRYEHVCENPEGVIFHIGCFAAAPGCIMVGRPSSHWTWFPGYRWRVALCGRCGAHLGWQFQDGGGGGFFGLILDRLRPCEGSKGY